MDSKIGISIVSYYNTIPFVYGLERFMPDDVIDLQKVPPSVCAQKLINKEVAMSLTPVGALFDLPEYHIYTDYCIGARKRVATVELFSCCPLNEIKRIYLDHDSRTSNLLVQVLAKELWHISPEWISPEKGYEQKIQGTTAGVIIGNRAFDYVHKIPFHYDLAEEWQRLTHLPFVFACWASLVPIDESFVKMINCALKSGLDHLDDAIAYQNNEFEMDIKAYLTENISFTFDEEKQKALRLFELMCKSLK